MIDYLRQHGEQFGIEPVIAVLAQHGIGIAPSTYWAHAARGFAATAADLDDAINANTLLDLWVVNRRLYGRRKLTKAARRAGLDLGRDQVERLMRIVGISGIRRGRHHTVTTARDDRAPRPPERAGLRPRPAGNADAHVQTAATAALRRLSGPLRQVQLASTIHAAPLDSTIKAGAHLSRKPTSNASRSVVRQ